MSRLQSLVPALALGLALVVGGETTDLLPCADGDCGAWSDWLYPGLPLPAGDAGEAPPAACLCHATFVSTARLPSAPAAAPGADALWRSPTAPPDAPARCVPHPPPRG